MISAVEYRKLVDELLTMEADLENLGQVHVETSEGPHAMFEQAISDNVPQQKAYSDYKKMYLKKKRIVEAYDMVARFELANRT
jgi:hypothetical protein